MTGCTRVVKVGGSLLTWSQLPERVEAWFAAQPAADTVLLAGGGPWAELLRQATRRFQLDEPTAHCICLQAMSVTASLLAELCACPCARSLAELESYLTLRQRTDERMGENVGKRSGANSSPTQLHVVFDVQPWLSGDGRRAQALPKSWSVSSDSIAACLAVDIGADELVLLKSRDAPASDLEALVAKRYIDAYFPRVAGDIPVIRYENLR